MGFLNNNNNKVVEEKKQEPQIQVVTEYQLLDLKIEGLAKQISDLHTLIKDNLA